MVDMTSRVEEIVHNYVEEGKYFTINRARQYGKTTLLYLLEKRLQDDYVVIRLSFEAADEWFESLYTLAQGFSRKIERVLRRQGVSDEESRIYVKF
ncbi:MAG: hypothetical protein PHD70_05615 [Anaerostipes sp.]|nr:hypothetical protein [Anaerostipes sp.]